MDYADIRRHGNTGHQDHCRYHSNNLPGHPDREAWVAAQAGTAAPVVAATQAAAPQIEVAEGQAIAGTVVQAQGTVNQGAEERDLEAQRFITGFELLMGQRRAQRTPQLY